MIEIINEALQWLLILLLFSSTGKLWKAVTTAACQRIMDRAKPPL